MSLEVAVVPVTPLMQNCTLMWCGETGHGVVIDPGDDVPRIRAAIDRAGMTVDAILLTHGHFDHVGGAMELAEATGAPIRGPGREDEFLLRQVVAIGAEFGVPGGRDVHGNEWLADGDTIEFGHQRLEVIHTPGHSPGHVVFHSPEARLAQVGDVLFQGAIGRTDFTGSDHQALLDAITGRLWPLGDDVTFIPGHGPRSTFGAERAGNPWVGDRVLGEAR
ncbi:MAG: MBL fold metallo-hydrolase [Thiohalospira sp.]